MTGFKNSESLSHFGLALVSVLLVAVGWGLNIITPLERPVSDAFLRFSASPANPPGPFTSVLIDDAAVTRIGPLPWPRATLAQLVATVRQNGAAAIVIDVLLSEPGDRDGDLALEYALSAGPIALASTLDSEGSWILPLGIFGGARHAAHVHAEIENDGVIRTFSATKQAGGLSLPALSVRAARLAGLRRAFSPGETLRPAFRPQPEAIPQVGASEVLAGEVAEEAFRDRVVFIGTTATGAGDQFFIPVGRRHRPTPGVLVHAAAATSIFNGTLLKLLPAWAVLLSALLAAGAPQILRSRTGRLHPLHVTAVAAAIIGFSVLLLWIFDLIVPTIGLTIAAALSITLREISESRDAQRETGAILHDLVREEASGDQPEPRGVQERLRLARLLQERLIRDRDLRRTLLEGLEEGVILMDAEGRPLLSNRALEQLWGHVPQWIEVVEATGLPSPFSEQSETAQTERHGRVLDVRLQPLPGERFLVLVRDHTAQRELEKRRREMQRLVSHELKTPLASIAGFGDMLERYSLSEEELKKTAGLIRSEAERLGAMVRTFLNVERIGAGQWEGEWAEVDLADLARKRCAFLSASAEARKIELAVEVETGTTVFGIGTLLSQVVDNLVGNAIKYSPAGSRVTVGAGTKADGVFLRVKDSGPGIPPEAVPHLFERFYRVPGAGASGSGLGLALVQEVIECHGARIEVQTTVGQGSTFTVSFSCSQGDRT